MFDNLLIGSILVAATISIHAYGSTVWLSYVTSRYLKDGGGWGAGRAFLALLGTVLFLMSLHLVQIVLWALTYQEFVPKILPTFEKAFYFSIVTFTTLGYGDVTLNEEFRMLSGIESLSGILLVGWTTAVMFSVVQRAWAGMEISRKLREYEIQQVRSESE